MIEASDPTKRERSKESVKGGSRSALNGRYNKLLRELFIDLDEEPMEKTIKGKAKASANWARLIHKICEVDPLLCPNCGKEMKISPAGVPVHYQLPGNQKNSKVSW